MKREINKIRCNSGLTLLEMTIAMVIMAAIFAVLVPQLKAIQNSWNSRAGSSEILQNGRVLIDHLQRTFASALQISAVSAMSETDGFIQFVDEQGNTKRYDTIGTDPKYIKYGAIGQLKELAGPVSKFQITCYDACDLDTPLDPVTSPGLVRLVNFEVTFPNSSAMGQDLTLNTSAYLRTGSLSESASLVGWWKLDETSGLTAVDSSIFGNDGTLTNMVGNEWTGGALELDGYDDYVDLPIGEVISSLTNCTITSWVNWTGLGSAWQRVWDFGSGESENMFLTPNSTDLRFAITLNGRLDEDQTTAPDILSTGWHHIAVTIDSDNNTHTLYLDGQVAAENTSARYTPSDLGSTSNNWLGRSQYAVDPYFNGQIDDVRIYNRVLRPEEIVQLYDVLRYCDFSEAKTTSEVTSLIIPTPNSNEGDLLITAVATDGDTSNSISPPFGEGWTEIDIDDYVFEVTLGAWWKLANASESSSHEFTWSGAQQAYGWMMRFTGHDSSDPINDWTAYGQTSSSPTSPAVITTVNNCLILRLGAFDDDDITVDNPGLSGHIAITMGTITSMITGLKGDYYDNENFTNLVATRIDPTVDFDWGLEPPDPVMGEDTFSIRWTGYVIPLYSETYTFKTFSDDGDRVWVDHQLLIDDWVAQHGPKTNEGTIALTAGQMYAIKVEYYDGAVGAKINLYWSSPSQAEEIIPQSQLYNNSGSGSDPVSGGAGYVSQSAIGDSGTSEFTLNSSNQAQMLTIAIAPEN